MTMMMENGAMTVVLKKKFISEHRDLDAGSAKAGASFESHRRFTVQKTFRNENIPG